MLLKDGAKVQILLQQAAIKSVPFSSFPPAPFKCVESFFRNSSTTWLRYWAGILDQTIKKKNRGAWAA